MQAPKIYYFLLFVTWSCIVTMMGESVSSESNKIDDSENVIFDLPDLSTTIENSGKSIHLEAFKSSTNDWVLSQNNSHLNSRLTWVSLGQPSLLKKSVKYGSRQIFHKNNEGYFIFIQMLTSGQRQTLASLAESKYGIRISPSQIVQLIPAQITCSVTMRNQGETYMLKGKALEFRSYPLRVQFNLNEEQQKILEGRMRLLETVNKIFLYFSIFLYTFFLSNLNLL